MQFIDLPTQQKRIRKQLEKNILAVLDHGKYIMGPEVAEIERRIQVKKLIGAPFLSWPRNPTGRPAKTAGQGAKNMLQFG